MLDKIKKGLPYFLQRKRYLIERQADAAADEQAPDPRVLQDGFWPAEYVVSRGQCLYRVFDLCDVKKEFRAGALDLQIRKWSPMATFKKCVVWQGGHAQVWIAAAPSVPADKILSESLFVGQRPCSPDAGASADSEVIHHQQLLELNEGYEGRVWRNNVLWASRFWKVLPGQSEWQFFLRGAGMQIAALPSVLDAKNFAARPWAEPGGMTRPVDLLNEKVMVLALLALMSGVLIWQANQVWLWQEEVHALNSEYDELSSGIGDILEARSLVQKNQQTIALLNELRSEPPVLALLATVAASLTEEGVWLSEFDLSNSILKVKLSNAREPLPTYVEAFERQPGISRVSAIKGAKENDISVTMTIKAESEVE